MTFIGIDIGSTSTKAAVLDEGGALVYSCVRPTGWSSLNAAEEIASVLTKVGFDLENSPCAATGYGRFNVPYARKTVTEITCHAKGGALLFGMEPLTIIDIGGQDTKIIHVSGGKVLDFIMNDKCSAGTGRFLEIMANSLSVSPENLLNSRGSDLA